jgi:hypothetical protein
MALQNSDNHNVTQHNVIIGAAGNLFTSVAPSATSGIPLVSNGASSDPSFTTMTVAGGGTGATSFTAYNLITGGTTSTGALQSAGSLGTAGQVLTTGATLPSWQTLTDLTTYSTAKVTLTNLQCTTLTVTPITLVAAQGAGTVISPISVMARLNYGGTNAFTGANILNIKLGTSLSTSTAMLVFSGSSFLASANTYYWPQGTTFNAASGNTSANTENLALTVYNSGSAIAGNAGLDNTIEFFVIYQVITM